jgi:signal transduction histidine kinase
MKSKILLYLPLFLLTIQNCYPQQSIFSVSHYTSTDGLPSSIVTDTEWDKVGFMWISTIKGIARFDGKWMKSFANAGVKRPTGSAIFYDKFKDPHYGDLDGLIYSLKNHRPQLTDSILRKKEGVNMFVYQLPHQFWRKLMLNTEDHFRSYNAPVVLDSSHFIITDKDKLFIYSVNTDRYTLIKQFAGSSLKLFKVENDIYIYEKGKRLLQIYLSGDLTTLLSAPAKIHSVINPATEIYWQNGMNFPVLVQKRNAYLLSRSPAGVFTEELICDNLPNDIFIVSIKFNPINNTTAVSTDGAGLYIYRKKLINTFVFKAENIFTSAHSFYSQAEVAPDKLWLPIEKIQLDLVSGKYSNDPKAIPFTSAFKVSDTLIYLAASDSRIYSYNPATNKYHLHKNIPGANTTSFAITEGRAFCATENGFFELSKSGDSMIAAPIRNNLDIFAKDMIPLSPGYLVICGYYGIYGFNIHTKKIDTIVAETKPDPSTYRSIIAYKGYLLACNYNEGIKVIKDNKEVLLPIDRQLYLRYAQNIFIDENNFAWISADAGILRIRADSLLSFFNKKDRQSTPLDYEYFGKEEGMEISELNGGRQGAMILLRDGNLSYAGINGIVNLDINNFNKTKGYPLQVIADKITVGNTELPDSILNGFLSLPASAKSIRIYLSIPDWNIKQNQSIRYLLKGYSDQWIDIDYSRQNYIDLMNLPPGEYSLIVKAASFGDQAPSQTLTFSFEIKGPWYKAYWIYALAAIIALLAITAIYKLRLYYLKKNNVALTGRIGVIVQEISDQKTQLEKHITDMEEYQHILEKDYALKNRLISIIGHDIMSPLRFMTRAGKKIISSKASISQADFDDTFKAIIDTGEGLHDMASNMLNWIKHHQKNMKFISSEFNLKKEADKIVQNLQPMASLKNLQLVNNIQPDLVLYQYPDPLNTILVQLLTNSIKYAEKGPVEISAERSGNETVLTVKDNGAGMSQKMIMHLMNSDKGYEMLPVHEEKGHGFGFLIIKDMLEIMKGKMKIESLQNEGCRISIIFPSAVNASPAISENT